MFQSQIVSRNNISLTHGSFILFRIVYCYSIQVIFLIVLLCFAKFLSIFISGCIERVYIIVFQSDFNHPQTAFRNTSCTCQQFIVRSDVLHFNNIQFFTFAVLQADHVCVQISIGRRYTNQEFCTLLVLCSTFELKFVCNGFVQSPFVTEDVLLN